jgi:MtN3 and saliva related transmembrane protein
MDVIIGMILAIKPAYIGITAGILTASSLLPQLIKMIREKKGDHTSAGMLLILLSGLGLWVWYGIIKHDWPLVLTNGLSLLVNMLMILLRVLYRHNDDDKTQKQ